VFKFYFVEPMSGIEPETSSLPRKHSTPELHRQRNFCFKFNVSSFGEPETFNFFSLDYLPMVDDPIRRSLTQTFKTNLLKNEFLDKFLFKSLWGEQDSNLRSSHSRFTVCPRWPLEYLPSFFIV
jgi:hypothetical protein